jgi:hypothetical protein
MNIPRALSNLVPGASWALNGDEIYANLEWNDTERTQPTEEEIATEVTRLQAEYDNAQYSRDRATAYPPMEDQLDDIFHNGVDGWKATIQAVKDTYPKPV